MKQGDEAAQSLMSYVAQADPMDFAICPSGA